MGHDTTSYILSKGVKNMVKHKRIRQAIVNVLRDADEPMTARQICDVLDVKGHFIKNPRHLSTLIRGLEHIKKSMTTDFSLTNSYPVNTYYYDDDGAEV